MWFLTAVTLPMVVGCHKVLFPQNEPRTQYQKTDTLRDKFTPLQEPDVFGNPQARASGATLSTQLILSAHSSKCGQVRIR